MIEQIARHLCEADGYDPEIVGVNGNPRWWLYTRTAEHTIPLLAHAWDEGRAAQAVHEAFVRLAERESTTPPKPQPNPYRQTRSRTHEPRRDH